MANQAGQRCRYIYNHATCGRCKGTVEVWDMAARTVYACTACQPLIQGTELSESRSQALGKAAPHKASTSCWVPKPAFKFPLPEAVIKAAEHCASCQLVTSIALIPCRSLIQPEPVLHKPTDASSVACLKHECAKDRALNLNFTGSVQFFCF